MIINTSKSSSTNTSCDHVDVDTHALNGLSMSEVAERLRAFGYNELPAEKSQSLFFLLLEVIREPMFLLLLACGFLYLLMGSMVDAAILLSFVFVVISITFYQERKTERALKALRDLSSPRALVIRDGEKRRIAGREVVRDDILLLAEGDRVAADGVVLQTANLYIDESLLSGESMPAKKSALQRSSHASSASNEIVEEQIDVHEEVKQHHVYAGTLVVKGQAIMRVSATGADTEMGKIGKSLHAVKQEKTAIQHETQKLVKYFSIIGLGLCLLVIVFFGITRGHWLQGFLSGLSLAMAVLPEEFPVVLTVFLVLGAWRIAQRKVLARHVPAVEMLGATTTLCVDKTGTLTLNKMSVAKICVAGEFYTINSTQAVLAEKFHNIVEYAILATPYNPFDPMEKAIKELGERALYGTEHLHCDWLLLREYPLSEQLLAVSHVWRSKSSDEYIIAAKGAPEAIIDLCHLAEAQKQKIMQQISLLATGGLRILGVARAKFKGSDLPRGQHDFDFEFLGLLGLSDPIRPEVPHAIAECYSAGVRVIMITGDYAETAKNIASQVGLREGENILLGEHLERLSNKELQEQVKKTTIFARIMPEQKLRIVMALKQNGEVVAMTGDGVNDAPALKAAHIGIAMGGRGTDVAREAAAMVLLDDNFASIVAAIRMGRRIFANLQKALTYIFAAHIPIAGLALIPVLLFWPLLLFPVHIAFLELIIGPVCSTVFEREEEEGDIMQHPPRNLRQPLFTRGMLKRGLLQGLLVLVVVAMIYSFVLHLGYAENAARAFAFITLVLANIGLIFTNRSAKQWLVASLWRKNWVLWCVSGGAIAFLTLALCIPFLRRVFSFAAVSLWEVMVCVGVALLTIICIEGLKIPTLQKWLRMQ